jgi:uncharacterized protein YbjT (DUF2867 family)
MATALILGATGLVGRHCVNELLAEERYGSVVALVRRASLPAHPKLDERLVDFDRLSADQIGSPSDVFCAIGTTIRKAGSQAAFRAVDYDLPAHVAGLAAAQGSKCFVLVSSVGADHTSSNFYLRVKGELEAAVNGMAFDAVHIMRPSFLMGERPESRPAERIGIAIAKLTQGLLAGPLAKYRPIEAATVSKAMVAAARNERPGRHTYHWAEIEALSGSTARRA